MTRAQIAGVAVNSNPGFFRPMTAEGPNSQANHLTAFHSFAGIELDSDGLKKPSRAPLGRHEK